MRSIGALKSISTGTYVCVYTCLNSTRHQVRGIASSRSVPEVPTPKIQIRNSRQWLQSSASVAALLDIPEFARGSSAVPKHPNVPDRLEKSNVTVYRRTCTGKPLSSTLGNSTPAHIIGAALQLIPCVKKTRCLCVRRQQ